MRITKGVLIVMGLTAVLALAACGDDDALSGGDNDTGSASTGSRAERDGAKGPTDYTVPPAGAATTTEQSTKGGTTEVPGGNLATTLDRKIIFTAKLDMTAEDVNASFAEAARLARNAGGFIERSNLYYRTASDGEERPYGTLTLRVPGTQYQDTLSALRQLPGAKMTKEESGSNEITEQYTDLQSRLRNLERSEAQYLKLLEQAKTIQEILTVQERVDGIRGQIESVQGKLKVYDDLVDLATIDVSLAPVIPGKAEPKDEGPKSVSESFADAWEWSLDRAHAALVAGAAAAAVAIFVLPAGLIVLVIAQLSRRRRGGSATV